MWDQVPGGIWCNGALSTTRVFWWCFGDALMRLITLWERDGERCLLDDVFKVPQQLSTCPIFSSPIVFNNGCCNFVEEIKPYESVFFHSLFTKSYLHSSILWKSLVIELRSKLHSGRWQVPPWPPHHLNSLLSPNFTNQAQLGRLVKVIAQFCSSSILMLKNIGSTLGHKVFLKRRTIMTTFSYFCMFLLI